jgi:hypothetical protein
LTFYCAVVGVGEEEHPKEITVVVAVALAA